MKKVFSLIFVVSGIFILVSYGIHGKEIAVSSNPGRSFDFEYTDHTFLVDSLEAFYNIENFDAARNADYLIVFFMHSNNCSLFLNEISEFVEVVKSENSFGDVESLLLVHDRGVVDAEIFKDLMNIDSVYGLEKRQKDLQIEGLYQHQESGSLYTQFIVLDNIQDKIIYKERLSNNLTSLERKKLLINTLIEG